jgi:hypothetical protein
MKRLIRSFVGSLVPAFILAGVMTQSATAQSQSTIKTVPENDKVRAYESWSKPGATNVSVPTSSLRVVRALHGGTLLRTYTGGKTEKVEWKTGEARIIPPTGQYSTQNIGKTEIGFYTVLVK